MGTIKKGSVVSEDVIKDFYLTHQKTLKELVQALFVRSKTIEKIRALDHISFNIDPGQAVGIIGKNGAGKSTLLKLIAGVSFPSSGKLQLSGSISPLIELGAGFHPELTGRENVFLNGAILGIKESVLKTRMSDIVQFAELTEFIDTPIKYYSSGMYMRLAFSVAVHTNPDILLVDEILAVGDAAFQKKCIEKMKQFKKNGVTIIFVSHDMNAVSNFCDKVICLSNGKIVHNGAVRAGIDYYQSL